MEDSKLSKFYSKFKKRIGGVITLAIIALILLNTSKSLKKNLDKITDVASKDQKEYKKKAAEATRDIANNLMQTYQSEKEGYRPARNQTRSYSSTGRPEVEIENNITTVGDNSGDVDAPTSGVTTSSDGEGATNNKASSSNPTSDNPSTNTETPNSETPNTLENETIAQTNVGRPISNDPETETNTNTTTNDNSSSPAPTPTTPEIVSITSTLADGSYSSGQVVDITVTFDESITTLTSTLTLDNGGTATYLSGSGSTEIIYQYTSAPGEETSDLNVTLFNIGDAAGGDNAPSGTLTSGQNLADNKDIVIDTIAPTVSEVSSTKADGFYSNTEVIDIQIEFSEVVTVSGTPTLDLNTTPLAVASYISGSGSDTLTFRYTVGATDDSADLDYITTTSLSLNAGTIQDAALNNGDLTLPMPGLLNSIADDQAIVIDNTVPTITQVSSTKADGTYTVGEVIDIEVLFSEIVNVDTGGGTPTLALDSGATVSYTSGSGSNTLLFRYTVGVGQNSADLDYTGIGSLVLNGGTIRDNALFDATLTLASPNASGSISDNQNIVIDTGSFTVNVYIRPTATGNADSCDMSPDPSLCYLTLSDVDGNIVTDSPLVNKDLVTQDASIVVHIDGDWSTAPGGVDDDPIAIAGWTTDATHFITIQTVGTARHNGTVNSASYYRLDPSIAIPNNGIMLDILSGADYTVIDGLIFTDIEDTTGSAITVRANNVNLKNNVIYNLRPSGTLAGIVLTVNNLALYVENLLMYGTGIRYGFYMYQGDATVDKDFYLSNSLIDLAETTANGILIAGDGTNDWSASEIEIVNTIVNSNASNDMISLYGYGVNPDMTGSRNVLTGDDSAQNRLGLNNTNSTINISITDTAAAPSSYDGNKYVIVQETTGAVDYHLVDNSLNLALGSGFDLTATIPNDIDGAAITASQHQIGPDFLADTTGPVVNEVYITETDGTTIKPDGAYGNAATMSFIIEFSQVINVTGTPQLTHNASATPINCAADATRWNALKCDYTVGATDASLDLDYASTTALALNSGTITDRAGNAATLTLPAPNAAYSASDNQAVQITAGGLVVDVYVRESTCAAGTPVNPPLCYTSLDAAFDNIIADSALVSKDLVAQNSNIVVHIQDNWTAVDTNRVHISGYTTDATHGITVQTEGTARHDGTAYCANCYVFNPSAIGSGFEIFSNYVTVDGLILTGVLGDYTGAFFVGSEYSTLKNNIIYDINNGVNDNRAMVYTSTTGAHTIENTIVFGDTNRAIHVEYAADSTTDFTIHNSTFVTGGTASTITIYSGSAIDMSGSNFEIVNTIAIGTGSSDIGVFGVGVNPTFTGSNRIITGDASSQSLVGLNNLNSAINVSVTDIAAFSGSYDGNKYVIFNETSNGSEDYHLVNNAHNLALGAGLDITATIPNDIDNEVISSAQNQIGADYLADTTGPVVTEVYLTETDGTTTKPDGAYGNAATMSFIIEFSQVINVTGTPQLNHNASATPINCAADATRWNALKCDYTVGATDASLDLDYASTAALALNGGTITDKAGNAATLTLPTPNATYSASDNQAVQIVAGDIVVDIYVRPTVLSCSGSPDPDLCYTNLKTAVDNIIADTGLVNSNLVTQNANIIIHIQEDWTGYTDSTANVNFGAATWTTDATHHIRVQTEGLAKHNGDVNCTTCYKFDPNAGGTAISFPYFSKFTEIDGLYVTGLESSSSVFYVGTTNIEFKNIIVHDLGQPSTNVFNIAEVDALDLSFDNILIDSDNTTAFYFYLSFNSYPSNAKLFLQNSTIIGRSTNSYGFVYDGNSISSFEDAVIDIRNTMFLGTFNGGGLFQDVNNLGTPTYGASTHVITHNDQAQTKLGLDNTNSAINVSLTDIGAFPGSYDGNKYVIVQETAIGSEDYHLVDNAYNLALASGVDNTANVANDIDNDLIIGTQNQIGVDYLADTTGPVVTEVYLTETDGTTTKPDGAYGNAATMSFIIEFSQVINVTGTPQLTHNASATPINCAADATRWNALKCDYTVGATDASLDLDYASTAALALNGGTITDKAGNAATLTLPTPNATYSASDDQAVQITAGGLVVDVYVRESTCAAGTPVNPPLCYTNLNAAFANFVADSSLVNQDLVTQNANVIIHIQDSWTSPDPNPVATITGYTTDATHKIEVRTEGVARHGGDVSCAGTCYVMDPTSGSTVFTLYQDYLVFDGLIITGGNNLTAGGFSIYGTQNRIKNTIIYDLFPSSSGSAISLYGNNTENWIENTVIYGDIRFGITHYLSGGGTANIDSHIYNTIIANNTGSASDAGINLYGGAGDDYSASNIEIINTAIFKPAAGDAISEFNLVTGGDFSGSTNILTGDATAQTVAGLDNTNSAINVSLIDIATAPVSFDGNKYVIVNETLAGSQNYHLVDNAFNLALAGGIDNTANVSNDIDGDAIVGTQNQIGVDYLADTTGPVVTEVYLTETDGTTTKPDGAYGNAATMSFIIEFSQLINVTGTPQLTHNASATPINCAADATRWNALKCDYTVGATDASLDLDYASTAALALNGGTITDKAGNAATLTLPTPNATYSASDDQAVQITAGGLVVDVYVRESTCAAGTPVNPPLCYTTLGAAFDNLIADSALVDKDLVTQNANIVVHIQDSWTSPDNGAALISGWVTDATHFITVQTEGVSRHSGDVSCAGTCYVIDPATTEDAIEIGIDDNESDTAFTVIDGLIITGTEANHRDGIQISANRTRVKNLIIYDLFPPSSANSGASAFRIHSDDIEIWIENVVAYGDIGRFFTIWSTTAAPVSDTTNIHIYNSIFHATNITAGRGILLDCASNPTDVSNYNFDIKNSAFLGSYVTAIFSNLCTGTPTFTGSTNVLTSDTTAQINFGLDNTNSKSNVQITDSIPASFSGSPSVIVSNLTSGSQNYHLVDNAFNLALAGGIDNTANVSNDIDGDAIVGTQNQIGPDYLADTTGPVVTEVYLTETDGTTTKPDGAYGNAATMSFIIEFSQLINVTGTPQLTHNASATPINCAADATRWNALKCDYTVGATDASLDLDYASTAALALNGGTITDKAGNAATLTLPTPNATYSASDDQAVQITAGASVVDVYVRPTATGNADSCDVSPNPSLCYLSLDTAIDNFVADSLLVSADLVTQNSNVVIHIQGDWSTAPGGVDSTRTDVNGFTTDATHFIIIQTEGVARHNGTANCSSCYSVDPSDPGYGIRLKSDYTVLDGVIITGIEDAAPAIYMDADQTRVKNSIIHNVHPTLAASAIVPISDNIEVWIENVLIYGTMRYGITPYRNTASPNITVHIHNTLVDIQNANAQALGFNSDGTSDYSTSTLEVINSAFFTNQVNDIYHDSVAAPPVYTGSTNVISGDSGAQTLLGLDKTKSAINVTLADVGSAPMGFNDIDYYVVQNTTPGSEDYNLLNSPWNLAQAGGVNLTASLPNDLAGTTITGSQNQIGPLYLVDSVGPSVKEVYITQTDGVTPQADGTYGNGANMSFVVEFGQIINVTGSLELTHNASATAVSCVAHPALWNALKCDYTVGATDASLDLGYPSNGSLVLNGATITDNAGNAANLALPNPGVTYSASDDQAVQITAGASVVDVYVRPTSGLCSAGTPANPDLCYLSLDLALDNVVADSALTTQDLVAQNASINVHIQDDWSLAPGGIDNDRVIFSGWTTDATHFITVQTEGVARHNGTTSCTSCYKIDIVGGSSPIDITTTAAYTVIDGMIIVGPDSGSTGAVKLNGNESRLKNSIVYSPSGGTSNYAVGVTTLTTGDVWIENVISYGENESGFGLYSPGNPTVNLHIHNSLVYINSVTAFPLWFNGSGGNDFSGSNIEIINTAFFSTSVEPNVEITAAVTTPPTFTGSSNVITGDGTAFSVLGLNSTNAAINVNITDSAPGSYSGNDYYIVTNLTSGSENFHLIDNAYNIALGAGADLTATIPNDIDGSAITALEHQIGPDFIADTTGPVVQEVYITETDGTTTKPDGAYGNAATMSFIIEFSQLINVTGTPQLTHNASATPINCAADATRWNALKCDYTVGATDANLDLDFASTTALALNGGTITDKAGNAATLTLPTPNATYSASDNQAVQITAGALTLDIYVRESTCAASPNPTLCYTSLATAFADVVGDSSLSSKDLVSQNVNLIFHIQEAWTSPDPNYTNISGWNTDATRFITVQTEGVARHEGNVSCAGTCYVMDPSVSGYALRIGSSGSYSVIDGIIITGLESAGNDMMKIDGTGVKIQNSIFYNSGQTGSSAIMVTSNNTEIFFENLLIYGQTLENAFHVGHTAASVNIDIHILNSTIILDSVTSRGLYIDGSGTSDYSASNIEIINTMFLGQYDAAGIINEDVSISPTYLGSNNILTSDDNAQSVVGLNNNNSAVGVQIIDMAAVPGSYDGNKYVVVAETNPGSENFHLIDNTYNIALGAGADLTATIPNDIDGDLISAAQYQIGADYLADTTGPVVTEVYLTETDGTTTKPDGAYGNAATMSFIIEFSQLINVTGTPQLTHNASATPINCAADATRWNALKCDYIVGAGDVNPDLDFASTTALVLNSGTITDKAGNTATLTLPTPNGAYSASDDQAIQITSGGLLVDVYVREDCTGAPGPCYTSLSLFDGNIVADSSLSDKDLVTQNVAIVIHIDQAWTGPDTALVTIAGWTTDTDNNITIQTEGSARHDGSANCSNCYVLDPSGTGSILSLGANYDSADTAFTVIDGLILTGSESATSYGIRASADGTTVRNTIVHNMFNSSAVTAFVAVGSSNVTFTLENFLVYNVKRPIVYAGGSSGTITNVNFKIHNSLFYGFGDQYGVVSDATGTTQDFSGINYEIINSMFFNFSALHLGDGVVNPPTFTGSSNVITSDNGAEVILGLDKTNSAINVQLTDSAAAPISFNGNKYVIVNETLAGSEDFHLADNSLNLALGAGSDLTATIPNDIDGAAITASEHQVGPDFIADTTGPIVTEAYITDNLNSLALKADGSYGFGAMMSIVIEFSQQIDVGGVPQLTINSTASPLNCAKDANRWNAIKCDYTVGAGDAAFDLDYLGAAALALNGGSINDKAGNAADLTLVPTGNTYSASADQAIVINADIPTLHAYVRETTCATAPVPSLCYTSLSDVDGNIIGDSDLVSKDLTANNAKIVVHIQEGWDNPDASNPIFSGWTTDATRFVTIQTEGDARHDGTIGCIGASGCYHIDPSISGDGLKLGLEGTPADTAFTVVDGLIITGTESNGSDGIELHGNASRLKNSIIFDLFPGSSVAGVNTQNDNVEIWIENVLIYGDFGKAFQVDNSGQSGANITYHLHNSLAHLTGAVTPSHRALYFDGSGTHDYSSSVVEVINTVLIADDISIDLHASVDPAFTGSTHLLTSDDDAQTEAGLDASNSVINVQITDTPLAYDGNKYVIVNDLTLGAADYRYQNSSGNIAQGSGVDLTATLPEDIIGTTILATQNPIGPFYISDTSFPVVNEVYITETDGTTLKPNGTYTVGETMSFIVEFSQKIVVTGAPELTLGNITNTVLTCGAHSGLWNALKCDYTVGGTDNTTDLDYLNTSALALAGGTIEDQAGNAAILTLPSVNAIYSASDNQAIVIENNQEVEITSAPAINDDNKAAYIISGTCSSNGTSNVAIDIGGITDTVDCSAGTFTSTLNLTALADSEITCPSEYVLVERNTKYTTEKFCVARYEMKDVGGVATSQPALAPWGNITREDAISECDALGSGQYYLMSNSQFQSIARQIELNPDNWIGGVVGTNGIYKGHSDNAPANKLAVTDIMDPYDGTGDNSSEAYGSGVEQRRTHKLSSGQEIWDFVGNSAEKVADVLDIAISDGSAYVKDITLASHPTAITYNSASTGLPFGFADANNSQVIKDTFGSSGNYPSLSSPLYGGLGRLYVDNNATTNELFRGGAYYYGLGGGGLYFTATDQGSGHMHEAVGFRCISKVSGGYLAQATHYAGSDSVTISKDTVDPSAPTLTGPSTSSTLATFTQTLTGACQTGAIVSISGDILGSPIERECINGSYSIEVTFTAGDDKKLVSINQTDLEGNTSTILNDEYDVFATPPTIAITSAPDINPTNYSSYTISGTCSPNNTSIIDISVGAVTDTGIDCAAGVWSSTIDATSLVDATGITVTANYGVAPSATDTDTVDKDMSPFDNTANLQFTDVIESDGNDVAVTWTAFSDTNLTDHRLKTYTDPGCTTGEVDHGLTGSSTNSDSAIIDGLAADGVYWATVTAIDGDANETISACSTDFITINSLATTYSIPTSGMELWIDADQQNANFQDSACSTAITIDGEPVGCTLDLSGNTNHGKQTTGGSRPTYEIGHQNSRNSLHFTNDFLVMDNEANFDFTGNEFTIFIVMRTDSFSVSAETIFSKGDQSFSAKRSGSFPEINFETGLFSDPSYDQVSRFSAVNDSTYRVGTFTFKDGFKTVYLDSIIKGHAQAPETYLYQNNFPVWLGGDAENTGRNLRNSYVSEFIIYDRKLSSVEIRNIEGYLSSKWGTAFTPASLSGVAAWYDGSDVNTLFQNSGCTNHTISTAQDVACWADKSENGNDAIQVTGSDVPVFDAANRTVNFDGTNDWLSITSDTNFPYSNDDRTIFGVAKLDAAATVAYKYFFAYGQSLGPPEASEHFGQDNTGRCQYSRFESTSTACSDPGNVHTYTAYHNGTNGFWYQDGNLLDSGAVTLNTTAGNAKIGNQDRAVSEFWHGDISEILLFNRELPLADRQKVEGYLACKWGTQAELPGGHPYSATCP